MTISTSQAKADVDNLLNSYTSKTSLSIDQVRELMEWAFMKGAQREFASRLNGMGLARARFSRRYRRTNKLRQ